jgi:cytochrome c oxidase subunit 2
MIGEVVVMEPADYQDWLDGRPAARNPVEAGGVLFQNLRCDTCHLPGPSARGPELTGRFGQDVALADGRRVRFDEAYVRESLLDPAARISAGFQPQMPSYKGQIGEDDVLALIAYLKSLSPSPESER